MSLFVIIGPQAVGKMTVGQALEQRIAAKLLFNHQTIDLFAAFLGYNQYTFQLSDQTRKNLFQAFVDNRGNNQTASMIFTVLIDFDSDADQEFLQEISQIFISAGETVYFIELTTDLATRLERNVHEARLQAKPSKRDVAFSRQELLTANEQYRLNSRTGEMAQLFPDVRYLKIDNTHLSPTATAEKICSEFQLEAD